MQRLNKSITHAVDRPVKVMQFGEGNFLRAFVDYIFDVTNEKTDFNGGVVIVKPIEFGTLERFHDQECQYTLQLRGFVDGQPKEITRQITSVVDAVAAIEDYDKYISGNDLPTDYNELVKIVNNYKIFGRVTPQQKRSIVEALKTTGTIGYIGDGVNDILALKEADCGIALASGISAARSVSEVVLTDSDFAILPNIVNEGRRVVNNIERVASMYLIKTTYSFLISVLCIILNHEYPFYPIQLSLISAICVGIPSFFLAIEPNYKKVKKGFLVKVFRNALPSGLCVFINIFFLIMISSIFDIDFEYLRIVVVATTGFLNLRLLYNISQPLSLLRKILVYTCSICFYALLIIFNKFLLVNNVKFISIVLIIGMIFANIYMTDFLEECYDWVVKKINQFINKRSRVVSEKK